MTRKLMALFAIVLMVAAVWYVRRPAEHIPPYDANLIRLAESELEAYCSGLALARSASEGEAVSNAEECREKRSHDFTVTSVKHLRVGHRPEFYLVEDTVEALDSEPDLMVVPHTFCGAIATEGLIDIHSCEQLLDYRELWPTYDGGVAWEWSEDWPYPIPDEDNWVAGGQ